MKEVFMPVFAIMTALISGLFLSTTASADGGFVVDMEKEEIQRLDGRRYLSDIAVGETAEMTHLPMCMRSGEIFLLERGRLADDDDNYSVQKFVTRVTGVNVTIEIKATGRASRDSILHQVTRFATEDCTSIKEGVTYYGDPTYHVLSINGASSFSELLTKPPFAGAMLGQ